MSNTNNKRKFNYKPFLAGVLTATIAFRIFSCATKKDKEPLPTYTENAFAGTEIPETTTEATTTTTIIETTTEATTTTTTVETTTETTKEPTKAPTATPVPTKEPTATPVPTKTPTATPVPTKAPTATPVPTKKPTSTSEPTYDGLPDYEDTYKKILKIKDAYNKINDKLEDINGTIRNFDYQKSKDKAIKYSKELIDFIFYGGTMNGITFDQLKDKEKQAIYEKLQQLDSKIMEYVPDYKERLGEKYNKVKDFAKTTYEKAKEAINSKVEVNINVQKNKSLVLKNNG